MKNWSDLLKTMEWAINGLKLNPAKIIDIKKETIVDILDSALRITKTLGSVRDDIIAAKDTNEFAKTLYEKYFQNTRQDD